MNRIRQIRVTVPKELENRTYLESKDYDLSDLEWIELGSLIYDMEPGQKVTFECVAKDTVVKE